jgi:hypothetical protein
MDTLSTKLPLNQLTLCMEDISTHLESIEQTIRRQIRISENGDKVTVLELKSLLPTLSGLQRSLHKTFGVHAQRLMGRNHIFKLPDEVLMKIFDIVRGDLDVLQHEYPISDIDDIKNVRLTCWRFCNASSHLLLHRLDVSLTTPALEHLDEVSRHPAVSQGIRTIHVTLYDLVPPASLPDFIHQVVRILRHNHDNNCRSMRGSLARVGLESFDGSNEEDQANLSEGINKLKKRSEIMLSCTKFLRAEELQPNEERNMTTLRRFYTQLRQLINEQEALLKRGSLVTCFAKAVARMPRATGLFITECDVFKQLDAFFRGKGLPGIRCLVTEEVSPLPRQAFNVWT